MAVEECEDLLKPAALCAKQRSRLLGAWWSGVMVGWKADSPLDMDVMEMLRSVWYYGDEVEMVGVWYRAVGVALGDGK